MRTDHSRAAPCPRSLPRSPSLAVTAGRRRRRRGAGATTDITISRVENGRVLHASSRANAHVRADETPDRDDPDRRHGHLGLHRRVGASTTLRRRVDAVPATPRGWDAQLRPDQGARTRARSARPAPTSFVCQVHRAWTGTVIVEGAPVETPTADRRRRRPTADADRRRRRSRPRRRRGADAPTPTITLTTPAPGRATPPRTPRRRGSRRVSVKPRRARRAAALLALRARARSRSRAPARPKAGHAARRCRSPPARARWSLRSRASKKGTYTVELRAVDAMGNKGAPATKTLKVSGERPFRPPRRRVVAARLHAQRLRLDRAAVHVRRRRTSCARARRP